MQGFEEFGMLHFIFVSFNSSLQCILEHLEHTVTNIPNLM